MSSHGSKPLIFFIHGACVTSWIFAPLLPILWSKGYKTWSKDLPSSLGDPNITLQDDIDFIRTELISLLGRGYNVIPLFYSYGSNPGPAALEGLFEQHQAQGGAVEDGGKVVGLIYATCVPLAKKGWTARDNAEYWDSHTWSQGRPFEEVFEVGPVVRHKNHDALDVGSPFNGDFMEPLLAPFSINVTNQPTLYDLAFKQDPHDKDEAGTFPVPTVYILAEGDEAIPTVVQKRVVKKYEGKFWDVWRVQGGHLWPLTDPQKVVERIEEFVRSL